MPSSILVSVRAWWDRLDHGQQISLSILGPCAFLTIALTFVSLQSSISMPFRASKTLLRQSDQLLAQQRAQAASQLQAESNKDTDGDGLDDADEARTFHTSPYLADTDSDGVPDGDEVRLGTDPNCPAGQNCYAGPGVNPDAVPTAPTPSSYVSGTAANPAAAAGMEVPPAPESMTAAQIRSYLVRTSLASRAQVDALPDDAVIELYRRAYADLQRAQSAASPAPAADAPAPSVSSTEPSIPSPSQISTP